MASWWSCKETFRLWRKVEIFLSPSLSHLLSSSPPSFRPSSLSSLYPSPLFIYSFLSRHLFIRPSLFFFLPLSTRLLCALPVSRRIPLVAQLRDSAGKLRLFKARSAGKASSCLKEAAWTQRTSPDVYTLAHKQTHMSHSEAYSFYYSVFQLSKPGICHLTQECLLLFQLWTFVTETRVIYFHYSAHKHTRCVAG